MSRNWKSGNICYHLGKYRDLVELLYVIVAKLQKCSKSKYLAEICIITPPASLTGSIFKSWCPSVCLSVCMFAPPRPALRNHVE